jgi:hypothetical protein
LRSCAPVDDWSTEFLERERDYRGTERAEGR